MTAFVADLAENIVRRIAKTIDEIRYWSWKRFQNGSQELQLAYQTVVDTEDSLDAIAAALQDGDYSEALRLVKMAKESLVEHVDSLRSLL